MYVNHDEAILDAYSPINLLKIKTRRTVLQYSFCFISCLYDRGKMYNKLTRQITKIIYFL